MFCSALFKKYIIKKKEEISCSHWKRHQNSERREGINSCKEGSFTLILCPCLKSDVSKFQSIT